MRVGTLQQLCQEQGIDFKGLKKRDLISALQDHVAMGEEAELETDDQPGVEPDDDGDGEVTFPRNGGGTESSESADRPTPTHGAEHQEGGSGDLDLLQLRLALAREEKERVLAEKERAESAWLIEKQWLELGLSAASNATQPSAANDIARLLPRMGAEGDVLTFFSAFERSLALNDVSRDSWSKFLGSCLTVRAHKALTLEQPRN